jgi:hypothetical protein
MVTIRRKAMNPTLQELSTVKLLPLLQQAGKAPAADIAYEFANVHRLIECLPLTSAAYCFAHNWLTSAQELWEGGDEATARYQVGLVAKKLALTERLDGSCRFPRQPVPCTPSGGKGDDRGPNGSDLPFP